MYKYCPNCHNSDSGTQIFKCRKCGHIGCFKGKLLGGGSGCWSSQNCPSCREFQTYSNIGVI